MAHLRRPSPIDFNKSPRPPSGAAARWTAHDQPIPDVERLCFEELAVPTLPFPSVEMFLESLERREVPTGCEARNPTANFRVQIRPGTTPVSAQEAVSTVVRNRHRDHLCVCEEIQESFDGRKALSIRFQKLGKVIPHQPKAFVRRVPRQQDDSVSGHSTELSQARILVVPVVYRQDGHGGVEGIVPEW